MNPNVLRIVMTTVVWLLMLGSIALAAILDSSVAASVSLGNIQIALMVMATIATVGIWASAEGLKSEDGSSQTHVISGEVEKAKRDPDTVDPRMALLVEMMDEDELRTFKERLKQQIIDKAYVTDDGEIAYGGTSLEDLIQDEQAARHR